MSNDRDPLTDYERRVLREIEVWKAKPLHPVAKAIGKAMGPVDTAMEKWVIKGPVLKAIEGGMAAAMDAGSWSISHDRVLGSLRDDGYEVSSLDDIPRVVPMEAIDKQVAVIARGYKMSIGGEGAVAGGASVFTPLVGLGALAADVGVVTTGSCRAIAHISSYYGYDAGLLHERKFAMTVLGLAGVLTETGKATALAEVSRVSAQLAIKKSWDELGKSGLVQAMQRLAKAFGVRLTKAKLAQVIAVVGVAVGGGVNYWYAGTVTEGAYFAYRERFIRDKLDEPLDDDDEDITDADVVDEDDGEEEDEGEAA